ncbi:MAG: hypothetical protein GY757_25185 [bacterium]|nr:hypothetical protein [bacterium]
MAALLGIGENRIGIETNFFKIGGHSLKATLLNAKIHEAFDVRIALSEIFKRPTIAEIAQTIEGAAKNRHQSIPPAPPQEYYPLSSSQKRLYIEQQMETGNVAYNLPLTLTLEGEIKKDRLEQTFKRLIDRHEALRTSFHAIGEEPAQKIHAAVEFQVEQITLKEGAGSLENLMENQRVPFEMTQAPLMRVVLIKIEEKKQILIFDMHHIVSDGMSHWIFIEEFATLYAEPGKELPPLKLQYKDYSQWQNSLLASEKIHPQRDYWKRQMAAPLPQLKLPEDYPEADGHSYAGDSYTFTIEPGLTARLKEMAKENEITLYVLLLAVYNILLSKYSRQQDIIVGVGSAGRHHADLEGIVGMFINMLPMRNRPENDKTFAQFLQAVSKNALDAYENQDYPLDELIRELRNQGGAGNSLFRTAFQLQNFDIPEVNMPGLKITPYQTGKKYSHFHQVWYLTEEGENLEIDILYSTGKFKHETVAKMAERYIEVLEQVEAEPEIRLQEIVISHDLVTLSAEILEQDADSDFEF